MYKSRERNVEKETISLSHLLHRQIKIKCSIKSSCYSPIIPCAEKQIPMRNEKLVSFWRHSQMSDLVKIEDLAIDGYF